MDIIRRLSLAVCLLPTTLFAGPVNVNTADAATLARELDGVGLARARAIVEYRERYGPFNAADELARVRGIGEGVLEKNRDYILLHDPDEVPEYPTW